MSQYTLNLIFGAFYIFAIFFAAVFASWLFIKRRKNLEAMRKNIYAKISSGIDLTSKDVWHIGKGFDLSAYQARRVIYKIYADASDSNEFGKLKALVSDIEKEEPFDDMPDEVKPSMVRLTKIIENTGEESDKHVLSPIVHTLNRYVDLKSEQEKLKKQTNRAYIVTVISFVVGAASFYFTVKSPTATDIAKAIQQQSAAAHARQEHNKSLQLTR